VLEQLVQPKGKPKSLKMDNEPEFAGRLLNHSAYPNGVETDFSRFRTSTDSAFSACSWLECLNVSWLLSLAGVRARLKNGGAIATNNGPIQLQGNDPEKLLPTRLNQPESLHRSRSRGEDGTSL
jgi:putative transposase